MTNGFAPAEATLSESAAASASAGVRLELTAEGNSGILSQAWRKNLPARDIVFLNHETSTAIDATTLFRDHAATVARLLTSLGVAPDDVEDLVQETFIVAHNKGGFVPSSDEVCTARPTTWLIRIAYGLLANHRRRQRRWTRILTAHVWDLPSPAAARPSEQQEAIESLRRLERAIEGLGPATKEAFVLCDISQCTMEEAAEILEIPLNTLYSRLHRARKALQAFYDQLESSAPAERLGVVGGVGSTGKVGS